MTDSIAERIGFMQGRLSPLIDGKIQAFPWDHWPDEFPIARRLGLSLMEWTLDLVRLEANPVMSVKGHDEIARLCSTHGIRILSLTADLFMEAPFWKADDNSRTQRLHDLDLVLHACAACKIRFVVVPLVDGGSMSSTAEENIIVHEFAQRADRLRTQKLCVIFECDYEPKRLAAFIDRLPSDVFGVNYDIGNSAALGYDCAAEISTYGGRILNVHVKDRMKGGTTVPLGVGNADLPRAIGLLERRGYRGVYILQTARAADGEHETVLRRYRDMTASWIAGGQGGS